MLSTTAYSSFHSINRIPSWYMCIDLIYAHLASFKQNLWSLSTSIFRFTELENLQQWMIPKLISPEKLLADGYSWLLISLNALVKSFLTSVSVSVLTFNSNSWPNWFFNFKVDYCSCSCNYAWIQGRWCHVSSRSFFYHTSSDFYV